VLGAPGATWHRNSLAMAGEDEGDEMRPEVGSPGHERQHNDGGSSSSHKQRRARESEREGGGKV
jgi:hypothetical protein